MVVLTVVGSEGTSRATSTLEFSLYPLRLFFKIKSSYIKKQYLSIRQGKKFDFATLFLLITRVS